MGNSSKLVALAIWAALMVVLVAACNEQQRAGTGDGAGSREARGRATDQAVTPGGANLFTSKDFLRYPPIGISPSRAGDKFFATITNPSGGAPLVYRFTLSDGTLGEPELMYESLNQLQVYICSDPGAKECIVLSNRKGSNGNVWDMVLRLFQKDSMYPVPFENTPGMPTSGAADTFYGTQPFYSWDGARVVIPLKHDGLVVQGINDKVGRYVAYPQLPFAKPQMALGPLPDANGKQRLWASFWELGIREDTCLLFTLDLASWKWQQVFKTNWVIYKVGGEDFDNQPWVVAGSRAPAEALEGRRFARFGRIDPLSGAEDLAEFYGTPDFDMALTPRGDYIAYTDSVRKALVRLKPATGEIDIDPRWYTDDAKVFIGESGDPVYAWSKGMLMRGEWSKHERRKGWDDD